MPVTPQNEMKQETCKSLAAGYIPFVTVTSREFTFLVGLIRAIGVIWESALNIEEVTRVS